MKKLRIYSVILFLFVFTGYSSHNSLPDNTLLKYYSALLTLNLNHAMESSRIIYHLSKESAFNKDLLEDVLNKIEQNVGYANTNIANITLNVDEVKKTAINNSLKNIDEHLAQVEVDIKAIHNNLKNDKSVTKNLSDIYFQIQKAENEDHHEIRRILKLKDDEEPLLVEPEIIQ